MSIVSKKYRSPYFENLPIPVQFIVLHYTAQSLEGSLKIFLNQKNPVSCHLLIDRDGKVYELVKCWEGLCVKAFHAGSSVFKDSKSVEWKNFNDFSLGIELVNWNGNIFHFTEKQYQSLFTVLRHLKNKYPNLRDHERILGHEHIAGFRGKRDPGCFFDWPRLFRNVYPGLEQKLNLSSILSAKQQSGLAFLKNFESWNDKKAKKISYFMEKTFLPFWLKKLFFWFSLRLG